MKIFAFVGNSNTGKTHLIAQLVPELKHRGYSVAVIKNCAHGFELDKPGKDSWNFAEAGADAVAMVSPDRLATLKPVEDQPDPKSIALKYFDAPDIVLVEGFKGHRSIRKVEVLKKGIAETIESPVEDLFAIVADFDVETERPLFRPDQIGSLADQISASIVKQKSSLSLDIDGNSISMNDFVQNILTNAIMGMIGSLDGIKENPRRITISLLKKGENG